MAAEQRKLLEQLMGSDAFDIGGHSKSEKIDLYLPKICKSFLLGECFYDVLSSVKHIGRCPKLHLEKYRIEYINQKHKGKKFPEFELEHEKNLEYHINDLKQKIEVANKRLDKTPEDLVKINQANRELEELTTGITISLKEIETLAEQGEITKSLHELHRLENLRSEKLRIQNEIKMLSDVSGFSGFQRLQVCEICGAYLSRIDNDKRLADHFMGKLHRGYAQLWESYTSYKKKNSQLRNSHKRSHGY